MSEQVKGIVMLGGAVLLWTAFNVWFYAYAMNGLWLPGVPMGR